MKPRLANNEVLTKARPASGRIVDAPHAQLVKVSPKVLLADVREMILLAREGVARTVNAGLVTLYWQIGARIRKDILREKRAEYGEQIVSAMGTQLAAEFGEGFGKRTLFRAIRFAEVFPDFKIVSALRTQLGWTHFRQIIPIEDPLKRDFYAEMCRMERWSTRTLEKKIGGMLFERTALSKKPDKLIRRELAALRDEDKLTPDLVFRDPYVLDFLKLKDTYAEKDIEAAILREIEAFILELGVGFCFMERQKRMVIDGRDYRYPNYDVRALAGKVCQLQSWQLAQTRFYTGFPSPLDDPVWNHFWRAKFVQMVRQGVHVFSRPLRYRLQTIRLPDGTEHSVAVGQEKGVDVRLAIDVVGLSQRNQFDVAVILSQDQDLSEVADEIRVIAREHDRWLKIASAFPISPVPHNRRGINGTDWITIDRATYDACLDARDYRPKQKPKT